MTLPLAPPSSRWRARLKKSPEYYDSGRTRGTRGSLEGIAHAWLTIRNPRAPRSLAPVSDDVRLAMLDARLRLAPRMTMWRCWVGFNLSHSLGLIVFGGFLTGLAVTDFDFVERSLFFRGGSVIVALVYACMAVRYWFWVPAASMAVAAGCFVVSALTN